MQLISSSGSGEAAKKRNCLGEKFFYAKLESKFRECRGEFLFFSTRGINPQKKSHADSYLAGISAPSLRDKGIIEDTKARYNMYAYFFRRQREKFKLPWRNDTLPSK